MTVTCCDVLSSPKMSDAKYFATTKKGKCSLLRIVRVRLACVCGALHCSCVTWCGAGELAELKADLQGENKIRKKEAVKKIIASMTIGKDVR